MNNLYQVVDFALGVVLSDPDFLKSGLNNSNAEVIVHNIITNNFPKCYNSLKKDLIKELQNYNGIK